MSRCFVPRLLGGDVRARRDYSGYPEHFAVFLRWSYYGFMWKNSRGLLIHMVRTAVHDSSALCLTRCSAAGLDAQPTAHDPQWPWREHPQASRLQGSRCAAWLWRTVGCGKTSSVCVFVCVVPVAVVAFAHCLSEWWRYDVALLDLSHWPSQVRDRPPYLVAARCSH